MEQIIRAAALLRLLAALSILQVSYGADSSNCQISVLTAFPYQALVLVNASAQLNNAEQQINSMNVNPIYDNIAEALERIDKSAAEAENLKTQGIYLSRSFEAYVALAENMASQVGRQDCYLNYTRPVTEDIYNTACAHILSEVHSYQDSLSVIKEDLLRLKVMVTENLPSTQLPLLESCLSIQASGSQSVRDCLQLYVHKYRVLIRNITAQVASDLNQIMSAEQCPYFTALRNNIDDSVALAAYNIKQYAEEVLYCAGLSPRALYEQSLNEIDTYISLYNDIINLQQNVAYEIKYANGNFTTDFESTMRNYLLPIYKAVELGLLYTAPEKHESLNTYVANVGNMIQSILANVSTQLPSTRDNLVAINTTLGNIAEILKQAINNAVNGVNLCLPKSIDCYLNRINEFRSCINQSMNSVYSVLSDTKMQFSTATSQFQPGPDNNHNILQLIIDNYAYVNNYSNTTANEILNSLGLTLDNSLPGQIVTSLANDYVNNVIQNTNSIQTVKLQLQNYTDTIIKRLDSDISAALKPIQNAIKVIQETQPGVDISTLNTTYNQLYANLKQNLTNYINSAYLHFTDNFNFNTHFNLTTQAADLKAKLSSCIPQNTNFTVSFNNIDTVTKCFEPYLKNATAVMNSTLGSIRTIVEGVDSLKNTTLSAIANYINTTLQNAAVNASVTVETFIKQYNTSVSPEPSAVNQLVSLRQTEIEPLLNYVTQLINNVKTSNLTSLVNFTSSVNSSIQPWAYAVNICNTSNPSMASNLSSQYPLINQLINNTVNSVYSTVTPYKQDALVIQAGLIDFTALLNKTYSDYNSTALATRCSTYNTSQQQYTVCINNITEEAKTYINGTLLAKLKGIADQINNLTNVADSTVQGAVTTQLFNTRETAQTEGSKISSMCNLTTDIIQKVLMDQLKNYNITPIYNYAASVRNSANTIMQRSSEILSLGKYTIYSSISIMNDAVGSANYITKWKYSFTNETNFANSIIDVATHKCLNVFPNVTQDANDLFATAININSTLDYQISLVTPSQLNTKCAPFLTDNYLYYQCISTAVNNFGAYYKDALKGAKNASDVGYKLLVNDTAKLNSWRDTVVTPESAAVTETLKPLAEKLLTDYNCTVDKLLGYAMTIISQRYNQYKPNLSTLAAGIYSSVSNVLQTNHSSILDITPLLLQLLQPLNQFIAIVMNSSNHTVLTDDVLNAPIQFVANGSAAFNAFLKNITIQAGIIQNNTTAFIENMEIMYQGLNYTTLYNKCYNSSKIYPLLELVACYNRLHYDFYMYLDKAQTQLKAYSMQITNLDVNIVSVITNYANNTLLVEYKRNICAYTAILYQMAGFLVPSDLQPCLPITNGRCKVEIIVNGKPTCIIFY